MIVEVKLFATFRNNRFKRKSIEVSDGFTVGGILKDLEIPVDRTGILLVNGLSADVEQSLADNDVVAVFPAIGGG